MTQPAQLGEVADIVRGIAFPKEARSLEPLPGHVACLRTANVQRQVEWDDLWFVPDEHVRRDEQFVRSGDILISTANSYELVGKVAPVVGVPHKATLGAFISLIRAREGVEPKYLYHQLAWGKTQARIRELASTTTNISNVSTKKLALLDLHVPALSEQRLVVAEIEKQFSRLDEAFANLQRVKANLKRYKAAVLTAAVSGNLVEIEATRSTGATAAEATGVRNGQAPNPSKKRSRDARSLGQLPEGWIWAEAADLASPEPNSICAGPFGTIFKAKDFRPTGVPIIFLRHVAPLRYLDRKPGFMDVGKWEALFKPYSAYGGELLITKLGEPPGVCAMYPRGIGPAMVTPDVIKMNVDPNVASPAYVMYYFNSEVAKRFATGAAFGTTRTRLTLPLFREMPVALPPLAEQHRIVEEVDRRLSIVHEVDAEVDANLKRAHALRQATLGRAFGGTT